MCKLNYMIKNILNELYKKENEKMRKYYIVMLVVLVMFGAFQGSLFSQFRIKPTVEINVKYEDGVTSKLKNISIFNKNKHYFKKLESNGTYIKFYDVKHGKYLINFDYVFNGKMEDSPRTVYFEGFYFNEKTGKTYCEGYTVNKFEVKENKNVKIDIFVSSSEFGSDFIKSTSKKQKHFNYFKIFVSIGKIIEEKRIYNINKVISTKASNDRNNNKVNINCDLGEVIATSKPNCEGTKCNSKFVDYKDKIELRSLLTKKSLTRKADKSNKIGEWKLNSKKEAVCTLGYFRVKNISSCFDLKILF